MQLRSIRLVKNFHMKCILFSSSSKVERVKGIKLNLMLNSRLEHEFFDNADMLNEATCERKSLKVSEVIVQASKSSMKLFQGIEKEHEKKHTRLLQ